MSCPATTGSAASAATGVKLVGVGTFASPVYLTSPPGDPTRLFVVERGGTVRVVKNGVVLPAPFLDVDAKGGTFGVRPEALAETFLQDCPPEIAEESLRHLARQTLSVTQQPVTASAWKQVPSTYLVCTEDRGTPVAAQREFAQRATEVVDIDAGHHPFLAKPEAVADLIAGRF